MTFKRLHSSGGKQKISQKRVIFELGELDIFDCSSRADIVPDILAFTFDAVAPEFACTATEGVTLVNIARDMVESLNTSSHKRIQNAEKRTDQREVW
ncbi:hypothetical protein BTUL_0038g00380 [Botrytis tulipae]|uniref:Uncharacterized protein n=1 Tax=Botrytis tulipae TaxID=87230 RepID=A0A4Z1EWW9_9HELO|nr:hypothetical protein BTUL_0038g00380 [Botrytis tulipae]